jgi:hypothetical protein
MNSISMIFPTVKDFNLLVFYGFCLFYQYILSFRGDVRLNGSPTRPSPEMAQEAGKSMWLF